MHDRLFINGCWRVGTSGRTLDVINPATERKFAEVAVAGPDEIDAAVAAARAAFDDGWGRTSGRERARYLRAIAQAIAARLDELSAIEVRDNGKPLPEARWDIEDAAGCFEYYAQQAEALDDRQGEVVALGDRRFESRLCWEPAGVAGQIIPWNYPLLMAAWKVAPALAAGCTSVLKPSELTPLTALELAAIAADVGLPRGVLNVVPGPGATGAALAKHPGIDKTAFTGSVPTGSKVMSAAAQDIKNISLELGGKSPFIVFDDADIEAAVEWIMFGIFWNQGEVCSATSRLLVEDGIAGRLLDALAEAVGRILVGDGFREGVQLGPLVSSGQYQKVLDYVAVGREENATLICGGARPQGLDTGYFLEPTVFADVAASARIWNEEIFGPVLAVRRFATEAEAVALANDTPFGLAAAVMSADGERCERVSRALRAGIVWVNCSQPTFTEAPWGGVKRSGIGRELGRWGLENYLEVKQVTSYVSSEPWGWYDNHSTIGDKR